MRRSASWLLAAPLVLLGHEAAAAQPATPPPGGSAPEPAAAPPASGSAPDPFADASAAAPERPGGRTWGYAAGGEIKPRYVEMEDTHVAAAPNPIGFYSGVSATAPDVVPPWAPADPAAAPPTLTWPGFQRTPTSSRVFFQVSRSVAHQLVRHGSRIEVHFPGTVVNVKNNHRPLELRFHRTPVQRVTVRRTGDGAVAVLDLRRAAEPTVSVTSAANGYIQVTLEFPDDSGEPGAEPTPTAPPGPPPTAGIPKPIGQ